MVSLRKDAAAAFALLKQKRPGDEIRYQDESGVYHDVILVRRGRQNARVRTKDTNELRLIPLEDIIIDVETPPT